MRCTLYQVKEVLTYIIVQTPQAQLMNNFISGAVGGFVGTALNTPWVLGSFPPIRIFCWRWSFVPRFDVREPHLRIFVCFNNWPPFQVVKSRIQGTTKIPGVAPKYNWTYPALVSCLHALNLNWLCLRWYRLVTMFREEGPAALYKGFVPKVLRLAPGGGVLLLVVEFTLGVFRKGMSVLAFVDWNRSWLYVRGSAGTSVYLIIRCRLT